MDNASLKHQLLIAMPQMDDPNFEHTVTYVVEHGDDGAGHPTHSQCSKCGAIWRA